MIETIFKVTCDVMAGGRTIAKVRFRLSFGLAVEPRLQGYFEERK